MKCGNTMRGIINCFELIHGASAWSASSWLAEIELRLSSPGRTVLASARPILARSAASGAFLRTSEKCCNSWSIRKATGSENILSEVHSIKWRVQKSKIYEWTTVFWRSRSIRNLYERARK